MICILGLHLISGVQFYYYTFRRDTGLVGTSGATEDLVFSVLHILLMNLGHEPSETIHTCLPLSMLSLPWPPSFRFLRIHLLEMAVSYFEGPKPAHSQK